jgi:hypothetical protein
MVKINILLSKLKINIERRKYVLLSILRGYEKYATL